MTNYIPSTLGHPVIIQAESPRKFRRFLAAIPYVVLILIFIPVRKKDFSVLFTATDFTFPAEKPFDGESIKFQDVHHLITTYHSPFTKNPWTITFKNQANEKLLTITDLSDTHLFLQKFEEKNIPVIHRASFLLKSLYAIFIFFFMIHLIGRIYRSGIIPIS